jgi:hypothetical protein
VYLPAIGHPATAKEEADNPLNVHENAGLPVRVTDTIFPAVVHVPSVMLPLSASTMPIVPDAAGEAALKVIDVEPGGVVPSFTHTEIAGAFCANATPAHSNAAPASNGPATPMVTLMIASPTVPCDDHRVTSPGTER